jgi:hypothetical protein
MRNSGDGSLVRGGRDWILSQDRYKGLGSNRETEATNVAYITLALSTFIAEVISCNHTQ